MSITCSPERTLSPPRMQWLGNLEIGQDSGGSLESERGRIVALEIEGDRVTDIFLQFLEGRPLSDDGSIDAVGGIDTVLMQNIELDDRFHTDVA